MFKVVLGLTIFSYRWVVSSTEFKKELLYSVFKREIFYRMNGPRAGNRVWMVSKVASGH